MATALRAFFAPRTQPAAQAAVVRARLGIRGDVVRQTRGPQVNRRGWTADLAGSATLIYCFSTRDQDAAHKLRGLLERARRGYQVLAIHTGTGAEEAGLEAWLTAWQLDALPVTADPSGAIRKPWDLAKGDCALLQHGCVTWRGSCPSRSPRISMPTRQAA